MPVAPIAPSVIAVPTTIWLPRIASVHTAKTAATRMPASAAARNPAPAECSPKAASADARAPESIAPSIPMLMTPARSVTVSPSAARASGVAILMVASRKAASTAMAPASVILAPQPPLEGDDHQDDESLQGIHRDRRN